MGLFDVFKPKRAEVKATKSALEAAQDANVDDSAVTRMIQLILNTGLDGTGPIDSARQVAMEARKAAENDDEGAIDKIVRSHTITGGIGGFVTGLGGFVTMPVALPANVLEFYVTATRMVGAIASVRGYDVNDPQIRTAVLLTLVGSKADDILTSRGVSVGGGRVVSAATRKLPPAALLMINKAVGFRMLRGLGEKFFARLGRGVPLVGGFVGGGFDAYMMRRIADAARREFPPQPKAAA